jgi:hypothetical protein
MDAIAPVNCGIRRARVRGERKVKISHCSSLRGAAREVRPPFVRETFDCAAQRGIQG